MRDASIRRAADLLPGILHAVRTLAATWGMLVPAMFVTACSVVSYTANERPPITALEGVLKIGTSARHEVIAALGAPDGTGSNFLPIDAKPRDTLSYYFEEGKMSGSSGRVYGTAHRTFLWVYFDHDRYDGYMWFTTTLSGGTHP